MEHEGTPQGQEMPLAVAVQALRSELHEALSQGRDDQVQFYLSDITLTLQTAIRKQVGGKFGVQWVVMADLGGSRGKEVTQTLVLNVKPLLAEDQSAAALSAAVQRGAADAQHEHEKEAAPKPTTGFGANDNFVMLGVPDNFQPPRTDLLLHAAGKRYYPFIMEGLEWSKLGTHELTPTLRPAFDEKIAGLKSVLGEHWLGLSEQ
jgi:Trypsin-co-occurring domain 2